MTAIPLDDMERTALEGLIKQLENIPPLSDREAGERHASFKEKVINRVIDEGLSWGAASNDLPIYDLPETQFFATLRATDNNLIEQINRFEFGLDRWFKYGEAHPPYFPWRIAVILSKRGALADEKRFLAAYCGHFHDRARRGSRRDQLIVERAIKKNAWDYW